MKHLMVEYTIQEEAMEQVLEAIQTFVMAIADNEPKTKVYSSYQKSNNRLAFVHFMTFEDAAAEEDHKNAEHTKHFVGVLYPHCIIEPEFTELNEIASTDKHEMDR